MLVHEFWRSTPVDVAMVCACAHLISAVTCDTNTSNLYSHFFNFFSRGTSPRRSRCPFLFERNASGCMLIAFCHCLLSVPSPRVKTTLIIWWKIIHFFLRCPRESAKLLHDQCLNHACIWRGVLLGAPRESSLHSLKKRKHEQRICGMRRDGQALHKQT